jgi:hypothetical protein
MGSSVRTEKAPTIRRRRPSGPLGISTLPRVDGPFRSALGSSVVEEFVAGHSSTDVLRELVQNEYDGNGTHLAVIFGPDGVHVSGNGETINEQGWRRMEVLLGTGRVIGSTAGQPIQPKVNGIGSKNFGLRSLFLFGNRIHVRSGGQMAVLDLQELGTQRLPDPASSGRIGVTTFVPYRTDPFQDLGLRDAALSYQPPRHNLLMVTPRAESSSSNCATPGEVSRSPGTMTAHSRFSRNSFDLICH